MNIRSKTPVLACLAAIAACGAALTAQEMKLPRFSPGETLRYEVTWSVFSAGEVVATVSKVSAAAADAYRARTKARSRGFASLLFKVDNEFDSHFDPQTLCSLEISKRINEGRRHKQMQIVFDHTRRLAVLEERDLSNPKTPLKHAENDIPACVQDVVSAFYFVRAQPLRVGQQLHVAVNDGAKTHDVIVDVQARERIQTPLGSRVAFRVEPKVFGALYKRKGRMLIWFSDDEQRLPIRVRAILSVGAITGTLKSVVTDDTEAPSAEP